MISSSIGPRDQLWDLLSCPNFVLSVGYPQIKPEPTMFVMLSYSWLTPRAYTITSLVWPILSHCSHSGGSPVIWKLRWVAVEPISGILYPPWFVLNIQLVLETCVSIFFTPRSWSICLDERTDFLWFTCIWFKLPPWIRESLFCFLWNHPKSVMHTCEVFCGSETCNLCYICVPSTQSHWLICSR